MPPVQPESNAVPLRRVMKNRAPDVPAPVDAVPVSGGLRLQTAIHHQRVLRPRPLRLLSSHPERPRQRHGHDQLARVLRLRGWPRNLEPVRVFSGRAPSEASPQTAECSCKHSASEDSLPFRHSGVRRNPVVYLSGPPAFAGAGPASAGVTRTCFIRQDDAHRRCSERHVLTAEAGSA